jgi:Ca2+-binding RTX toxin-like protein
VAGNQVVGAGASDTDIEGVITRSNGHNIFGSDVTGAIAGDRELIDPAALFADINPATGGGMVNDGGIVQLLGDVANPALGGSDRFATSSTDQLGIHRPTPSLTNPDLGAAESGFVPSHVPSLNNDSIIGNGGTNELNGLAGDDFLKGLAGNDTLNGGDGNDFLEGNRSRDCLNGGAGIDIANYGDSNESVRFNLRGDAPNDSDTAIRGDGHDKLTGIEGAIGGGGRDRFWGDNGANWFQGGGGKDTFTGGGGNDLYDYNLTKASPAGARRDVITDFDHLVDKIDLMGIVADTTVAGNQDFRWVGGAALTGPGEAGYFTSGGNIIVRMSTDADAASESEIQLNGIKTLSELDFYL